MTFDENSTLQDVIEHHPHAEEILSGFGLHCFSCPFALQESLREASALHGVDMELLLAKLNEQA